MPIDIRVLGPIRLLSDGREVRLGDRKQRLMLAILAIENRLLEKPQLIGRLWDEDKDPEHAVRQLHSYANRIRAALNDAGLDGATVLTTVHDVGYRLDIDRNWVDYHRFLDLKGQAEAAAARRDPAHAARFGRRALAEWGGAAGLLGGTPLETDAHQLRGRIRAMQMEHRAMLMLTLQAEMDCGQHRKLIPEMDRLAADNYASDDQELARLRMLAHFRAGQTKEAIAVYERLEDVLEEKTGSKPDEETREMQRRIKKDDETLKRSDAMPDPDADPEEDTEPARGAAKSITYQTGANARAFTAHRDLIYNEGSETT